MSTASAHLVIGGTGFIGSELCRTLANRGERVVSISKSGRAPAPNISSVAADLYRQSCPQDLIEQAGNVYILVGQNHASFDRDQELQLLMRLVHQLEHASARVHYFSSALVYGHTLKPAAESSSCNPVDSYSAFKLEAEQFLTNQLPPERLTILRLSNVYGTPQNRGFIGHLMTKLAEAQPHIALNGNGEQKRDYIFVDDLIHAIMAVVMKADENGTVNIATGTSYSLLEIISHVAEIAGRQINYDVTHRVIPEPQDSLICNQRLREVYEYADFTSLADGLAATLTRYQEFSDYDTR